MEKQELSFGERLKLAKRAAMKTIAASEPLPAKKPAVVADVPKAKDSNSKNRPAKRRDEALVIALERVSDKLKAKEQLLQIEAELRNDRRKKESEISRQIAERDERRKQKKKLQAEIETLRHFEDKQPKEEPKAFVPIIGQPNSKGETPVMFAPGTTAYVKPGRDIEESIAKWVNRNNKPK